MSSRQLISDAEKDKHKTRSELLDELSEVRARLAAKTEEAAGRDRVIGMLNAIEEPVLILDDELHIVYANSAAKNIFWKGSEAIEGRSLRDVYPKASDTLFYHSYEVAKKSRSTGKFRERHRLLGKWFEVYLYPVPGGMTVLFIDITTSRQMEELPRLALILLHNLKDNVFLVRGDGRLFHVNNETKHSLGYSSDEIYKIGIFDVVPSDCRREWQEILDRIRQHGSMTFESRLLARDGHEFPVEIYASHIELYGNSYYTVSARDITERKHVEQERAFMASIVASSDDAIIGKTLEGIITSWNDGAMKLYGYQPEETIGQDVSMLEPPDRKGEIAAILKLISNGKPGGRLETLRQRKDGRLIDVSLIVSPIIGEEGRAIGASTIAHDIRERKQAEQELRVAKTQAELYVDLMGHDINNMNQIALGNLELAIMALEQEGGLDMSSKPLLEKSVESLTSSSQLIQNVQKLQRLKMEEISLRTIDAIVIVEAVAHEFRQIPGKDLRVDISYSGDCRVRANDLLKDVFLNLIGNSVKHSLPDRPLTIWISAKCIVEDGKKCFQFVVEDNGPGIRDEMKEKLFTRFARGQTKARGSGLGLYLVRTLVKNYDGRIEVGDRVPGDFSKGAKFVVTIPSAE